MLKRFLNSVAGSGKKLISASKFTDPNVTITSTTETTIVFTCSPSAACIGLEFGGSDGNPALSPFTNDSSTILGLSPGTSYNVSVDNGFDVDAACTSKCTSQQKILYVINFFGSILFAPPPPLQIICRYITHYCVKR